MDYKLGCRLDYVVEQPGRVDVGQHVRAQIEGGGYEDQVILSVAERTHLRAHEEQPGSRSQLR